MSAPIRVSDVRRAVGEYLHAQEVAVYKTDSPYVANDRAVFLRQMGSSPDVAVAVEVYGVVDELVLPNVEIRVQLLFRGPGDTADDFADDVFQVLHDRHHFLAGDLRIQRARRLYATPIGVDDNQREQRTDNYGLTFMRP